MMKRLGRFYVSHFFKAEIEKLLKSNKSIVLFIEGVSTLGDASLFLSSILPFEKQHPDTRAIIITSRHHYKLCSYFVPEKQIKKKSNIWRYLIRLDFDAVFPLEYFVFANRVYSDLYGMIKPSFGESSFVKWRNSIVPFETTTIDYYAKFRLHLPDSWQPTYPILPNAKPSKEIQIILDRNLPFVLINAASRTGPSSADFSTKIIPVINYLKTNGFLVFTNTIKNENPIMGTECLDCSIEDLFCLCKKAKLFISVRSGILDFVVSSGCPIISLLVSSGQNTHYPLSSWKTKNHIEEILLKDFGVDYVDGFLTNTKPTDFQKLKSLKL